MERDILAGNFTKNEDEELEARILGSLIDKVKGFISSIKGFITKLGAAGSVLKDTVHKLCFHFFRN